MLDTAIIGAGPIGIAVAAACKQRGIEALVGDAGCVGATLTWWAPGTRFFSSPERIAIAGVPLVTLGQEKATREEYLAYLRQVVSMHDLAIRTHTRVHAARREDGGYVLETGTGTIRARRLVLAIGNLHRPRALGIECEDIPGVSHYLGDPHTYFGERVLIVGGKNSAVEAAIRLHRIGARVTISYRQDTFDAERIKYWLLPELLWLIKKRHIGFLPETIVSEIRPGLVARLRGVGGGGELEHEADRVLLLTGYEQDTMLFDQFGVELVGENRAPATSARTMETNVPNVYVAGTAVAGTERRGVTTFIETSHVHVARIVAALAGEAPPEEPEPDARAPET